MRIYELHENISKNIKDASNIFGGNATYVTYTDDKTNSFLRIVKNHRDDNYASITDLFVPDKYRGKGIGKKMLEIVMAENPKIMGQISSKAAAVNAYKSGRRPHNNPNATIDDIFKIIDNETSVNLMTLDNKKAI